MLKTTMFNRYYIFPIRKFLATRLEVKYLGGRPYRATLILFNLIRLLRISLKIVL